MKKSVPLRAELGNVQAWLARVGAEVEEDKPEAEGTNPVQQPVAPTDWEEEAFG